MNAIRHFFDRLTQLFSTQHLPLDDRYAHSFVPRGESFDESVR